MGNYASNFDFPARAALSARSFEQLQYSWTRAKSSCAEKGLSPQATITRAQFMWIFQDDRKRDEGIIDSLPVLVFRVLDADAANSVVVYELFMLSCLFCAPGSSVAARYTWALTQLCGMKGEIVTQQQLASGFTILSSALRKIRLTSRVFVPEEVPEVVRHALASAAGDANNGEAPLPKFMTWLTSQDAVHNLVTRFQMTPEAYEKRVDTGGLPDLVVFGSEPTRISGDGTGPSMSAEELEEMRQKMIASVTGRHIMSEMVFKTGLSQAELAKLKEAFSARANEYGVLTRDGFKDVMIGQFPALKGDPSLDRLFNSFDSDNSGSVEFRELVLGAVKMTKGSLSDKAAVVFQLFDADGSGSVTIAELMRFVREGDEELHTMHQRAQSAVAVMKTEEGGVITEQTFVNAMVHDPLLTTWFQSVTSSPALQVITRCLEEVANVVEGSSASHVMERVFNFKALITFWNQRQASKKGKVHGGALGNMLAAPGPGGQKAASGGGGGQEAAQFFAADTVVLETFPKLLSSVFGLRSHGNSTTLVAAITNVLESIAAAAPPNLVAAADTGSADMDIRSGSLADRAVLPTQFVLSQLGLCLAKSQDQLATVLYRFADFDGDGEVRAQELTRWMLSQQSATHSGLAAAQKLLVSLDLDGDGKITETEFRGGISKKPALLESFALLLGAGMQRTIAPGSPGGADSRGNNGGSHSNSSSPGGPDGALSPTLHTTAEDMVSADAGGGGRSDPSFGGKTIFGIGEEEQKQRRKLSLIEKIERRRRSYHAAAHSLSVKIEREKRGLEALGTAAKESLSKVQQTADSVIQRQKLMMATFHMTLKPSGASSAAAASRPSSAAPSRQSVGGGSGSGSGRPSTASTAAGRASAASGRPSSAAPVSRDTDDGYLFPPIDQVRKK